MKEVFEPEKEILSPDDMSKKIIQEFLEEEGETNMRGGNIGILQHNLESKIAAMVRGVEKDYGKGEADLIARHVLFDLNAANFHGKSIEGKSDEIKGKAVEFLEDYLKS